MSGITAFYARVTRDESKATSIPNQKRRFRSIADQRHWDAVREYVEPNPVSGELGPEHRPALKKLIADIQAGQIGRVVVRHLDRLGRGEVNERLLRLFVDHAVELWTFDSPQDITSAAGRFNSRVQSAAGAFEVERDGERVREMKVARAQRGLVSGGLPPFGYVTQALVKRKLVASGMDETDATAAAQRAMPVPSELVIEEEEAQIVREVFDRYALGREGTRLISLSLNERGVSRRGYGWTSQAVRKVIRNPKYAGWTHFDTTALGTGRKSSLPPHRQEKFQGRHEAIVDRTVWEAANALMDRKGQNLAAQRVDARTYALSGVLHCPHGHGMKGSSTHDSARDTTHAYYVCGRRARLGPADTEGCTAPIVRAEEVETGVRDAIVRVCTSASEIERLVTEALSREIERAPLRTDHAKAIQKAKRKAERDRASLIASMATMTSPEDAIRVSEQMVKVNVELQRLDAELAQLAGQVVTSGGSIPTSEDVARFMSGLGQYLQDRPDELQELLELFADHHGLKVNVLDACVAEIELFVFGTGKSPSGDAPRLDLKFRHQFAEPKLSAEEWAAAENAKGHLCACGCGGTIEVLPRHRAATVGIPKVIQGHHKMRMTEFVEDLNVDGFLTVSQAAKELGIGETTLRRCEERGWIEAERRAWGNRQPMRVFKKADLPKLREKLVENGFRFADDEYLTTAQVAAEVGVAESTLRRWEKLGLIPAPERDSAGRRKWTREHVDAATMLA